MLSCAVLPVPPRTFPAARDQKQMIQFDRMPPAAFTLRSAVKHIHVFSLDNIHQILTVLILLHFFIKLHDVLF